jgi:hypothetical protein
MSFAHESVQHKQQRRSGDLIEQTGAHSAIFTYTIPMRSDLFPSLGYGDLFGEALQRLLDDCRDSSPGDLFDPVYGYHRCVPGSYTADLSALKRDGEDIRLEFKHSPLEGEDDVAVTPNAVANEAEALTVEATTFQREAKENEEISPNTSIKLTEAMSRLSGFGRAVLNLPNDARNEINKIVYWAKEIEDITTEATSPAAIATRHRARETREKALRLLDNANQIRPVKTRIVSQQKSLASLAAEFGVPFEAFLLANPAYAALPLVPVGSRIVIPDARR